MIELLIGMAIAMLVGALAIVVLRTAVQTQGVVTSRTVAVTRSHTIGDLIDTAVHNAVGNPGFKISSDAGGTSNRLDLQLPGSPYTCATFEVSPNTHELYLRKVTGARTNALSTSTWTALLTWGQASSTASMSATQVPDTSVTPTALAPYFTALTPAGVTYSFRLTGADTRVGVTSWNTDVVGSPRQRATGGAGGLCF